MLIRFLIKNLWTICRISLFLVPIRRINLYGNSFEKIIHPRWLGSRLIYLKGLIITCYKTIGRRKELYIIFVI